MKKFFKSLFSSEKGSVSSKRVFGGLGFLVCIVLAVISVVMDKTVPAFCSELLYTCAALLGIDSVAGAFYKNDNNTAKKSGGSFERYKYDSDDDSSDKEDDEY